MSIKIKSQNIFPELSSSPTDFAIGSVLDKIRIEIELTVSTYTLGSTTNKITLNATDALIGDGWAKTKNNGFKDFKVGDTVNWSNYTTGSVLDTFTIIAKLNNNTVQFDHAFGLSTPDNFESIQSAFSVTTPVTGIRYRHNFVENSAQPSFLSAINGEEILMSGGKTIPLNALVGSFQDMEWIGRNEQRIGSATIAGVSAGNYDGIYESHFKIIHYSFIQPFYLAANAVNLRNGSRSPYFLNEKCLKFVFQVDADYDYNNPNGLQRVTASEQLGNTGEYDENNNTGLTNYSITDVTYTRADTTVIEALELTEDEQTITFNINNATDAPFVNLNSEIVFNFLKVVSSALEYNKDGTGSGRTLPVNFCFDRKLFTVGAAPINGDNYGTTNQSIKTVSASLTSASVVAVTVIIAFAPEVLSILNESETPAFRIVATTQDYTLDTLLSDRVPLTVADRDFFIDNADPGMIISTTKFLRHVDNDYVTEGKSTISVFPKDEVVAWTRLVIDKTGRTSNVILLRDVTFKIKIKNIISGAESDLEVFTMLLSNLQLIGAGSGQTQFIDFSKDQIFHIPVAEIRKNIRIKRRQDLDAGDTYYYDFSYPFLIRWEYWIEMLETNSAFFDISKPLNGLNNFWHRLATTGNWKLFYEIKINATKDGIVIPHVVEKQITSNDFDSNPDWINNTIKSYDAASNAPLYDAVADKDYILGYADTLVEARFESNVGAPDIANTNVELSIESFEQSGIAGKRRMSSAYPSSSDTWFKSTTTTYKTTLELDLDGVTVIAQSIVDYLQLPNDTVFEATARLYSPSLLPEQKQFEDEEDFDFEDGDEFKFQDEP